MFSCRINAHQIELAAVPPSLTLLEFLRDHLGLTGTKEGCASGDCGACTVLLQGPDGTSTLNSCITPLGAVQDRQLITVEGVGTAEQPHPVQHAMVEQHASQCGFCTPGFVISLVNHAQNGAAAERDEVAHAIGGNLCRCTGYRPIIDAGVNAMRTGAAQTQIPAATPAPHLSDVASTSGTYQLAATDQEIDQFYQANSRLVAGGTDLWLEVTQQLQDFEHVVDLSRCPELQQIEIKDGRVTIGAAVTHAQLYAFLEEQNCPALLDMLMRFGSPQIRSRGTIGGNIGNASPIADWPPALLALDAELELQCDGSRRTVALDHLNTGYKQTVLTDGEWIRTIQFDLPDWQVLQFYKVSKRFEDDISSVAVAVYHSGDVCRIGLGGVAATPVRLHAAESLVLQGGDAASLDALVAQQVQPIDDVRASAQYRLAMTQTLIKQAVGV